MNISLILIVFLCVKTSKSIQVSSEKNLEIELKIDHSYQGYSSEYVEQLARYENLDYLKYNISLDCIVYNAANNPKVQVLHGNDPIHKEKITELKNYFKEGIFHHEIVIANASLNDCGEYVCRSVSNNISTKVSFYPNHYQNSEVELKVENQIIQVNSRESLEIQVEILNYKNRINCFGSDFYWMKGNGILVKWPDCKTNDADGLKGFQGAKYGFNRFRLFKEIATVRDNGNYTFVFNNSISMKSISFKVIVIGQPGISFTNELSLLVLTVKPSTILTFDCEGWSDPGVNINFLSIPCFVSSYKECDRTLLSLVEDLTFKPRNDSIWFSGAEIEHTVEGIEEKYKKSVQIQITKTSIVACYVNNSHDWNLGRITTISSNSYDGIDIKSNTMQDYPLVSERYLWKDN